MLSRVLQGGAATCVHWFEDGKGRTDVLAVQLQLGGSVATVSGHRPAEYFTNWQFCSVLSHEVSQVFFFGRHYTQKISLTLNHAIVNKENFFSFSVGSHVYITSTILTALGRE